MSDILSTVVTQLKVLCICIVESFKAFLPNGVISRKSVAGKVILITGSGSGIGRLMAIEFAKLGAKLILWDINEKGLQETKEAIEGNGGEAVIYKVDLSKRDQIYNIAEEVKADIGNVDILVNNAGVVSGKPLMDCTDAQIELTMAVNTMAHIWTTRSFLPHMLETNSGHIVNIASIAGKCGTPALVDYCTSKYGAVGFHDALTAELVAMNKSGVQTTLVCPFFISTGLFDGFQCTAPRLMPPLTPEYVVECVLEAVLTNRYMVSIPRFSYIAAFLATILPTKAVFLLNENLGVNDAMKKFTGRLKKD